MKHSMIMEVCLEKYNSNNCPLYLYTKDETVYKLSDNEYLGRFYDGYKFHIVKYKIVYKEDGTYYYFNLNKKEKVIYCNNYKICIGRLIPVKYIDENILHTIKV